MQAPDSPFDEVREYENLSNWVMMNKETRRLSKIPDEIWDEIENYFVDAPPVVEDDGRKLQKLDETTADYARNGLTQCLAKVE